MIKFTVLLNTERDGAYTQTAYDKFELELADVYSKPYKDLLKGAECDVLEHKNIVTELFVEDKGRSYQVKACCPAFEKKIIHIVSDD